MIRAGNKKARSGRRAGPGDNELGCDRNCKTQHCVSIWTDNRWDSRLGAEAEIQCGFQSDGQDDQADGETRH
jgi:hypothetical protein